MNTPRSGAAPGLSLSVAMALAAVACAGQTKPADDGGADAGSATDAAGVTDASGTKDGAAEGGSGALTYYEHPCGSGDPIGCVFTSPVEVPDSTYKKCSELGVKKG